MAVPAMAQEDSVTLNFELTVSGEVPEGTRFIGQFGIPFSDAVGGVDLTDPDGDGVYTGTADSPLNQEGETAYAFVYTTAPTGIGFDPAAVPIFPEDYEVNGFEVAELEDDATVTAWVSFGGDVQDDAGDTQDDEQDDTQDDSQGETPGEMPDTGAGGMAGATIPAGGAAAAVTMLLGTGYLLRRW
jgi:hypothetical protein